MPVLLAPRDYQSTPEMREYAPRGRLRAAFENRGEEIVVSGPAGTGKSRMWLEKLNYCADRYPGMRALIARKTRESLTESALVTFEEKVLPAHSPIAENQQRRVRQSYDYPNGSTIVIGGLDKPSKIMSTEYDLIYVQEAIEITEAEWEAMISRLRNGVLPYQQIIGDTNPDAPGHWIKRRSNRGQLKLVESRHEDNPMLFDDQTQTWTKAGLVYIRRLDSLTGVRHKRLRRGLWVAAEGMVYQDYDPAVHLIDRFEIPAAWPRYRVIDFGFTNPFVCQWWAEDPDGRLYLYRELYGVQRIVEDWAHAIFEQTGDERILATVCDHDAEGRATLERHMSHGAAECNARHSVGYSSTLPATKDVQAGVDAVASRLKPAGDGKPRLFILRDSQVYRDPQLEDSKKPTCSEEEIESYVWDEIKGGRQGERTLEEPLKRDDHGMDCIRYMAMYLLDPVHDYASAIGKVQPMAGWRDGGPRRDPSPFGPLRDELDRARTERRVW